MVVEFVRISAPPPEAVARKVPVGLGLRWVVAVVAGRPGSRGGEEKGTDFFFYFFLETQKGTE